MPIELVTGSDVELISALYKVSAGKVTISVTWEAGIFTATEGVVWNYRIRPVINDVIFVDMASGVMPKQGRYTTTKEYTLPEGFGNVTHILIELGHSYTIGGNENLRPYKYMDAVLGDVPIPPEDGGTGFPFGILIVGVCILGLVLLVKNK